MRNHFPPAADDYPRPHHDWSCGLGEQGRCWVGPDAKGACPAAAACHPRRDGDRWLCNRSALRGGPCAQGPDPDGACATICRCTPIRSLRSRRGQFALGSALAAFGALTMTLSAHWRSEAISPGPLAAAHAQLLHPDRQTERCGACHGSGNRSVWSWVGESASVLSHGAGQTELCLNCHDKQIDPQWALASHTSARWSAGDSALREGRPPHHGASRRRDPADPIACAACHREHQGTDHSLAAIDDQACQACHRTRFASFAADHSSFGDWPYLRRTPIQFDHANHEGKHFPDKRREFSCAGCHASDASGMRQITLDYDVACAACHDEAQERSWSGGVALASLPELDDELLEETGRFATSWPAEASGDFDGGLPTINRLLLASDPIALQALTQLGWQFNAFDVDLDDPKQLESLADLMSAQRRLIDDLAEQAQSAIAARLETVLGRPISPHELSELAARISPDLFSAYRSRWFDTSQEPQDAKTATTIDREQMRRRVAGGGWMRDETTRSLTYRPLGHDDPFLRAWIDILCEATRGPHEEMATALLGEMVQSTAPGLCGSCHSVERNDAQLLQAVWQPLSTAPQRRGLTFFDHRPHLTQPQLRDCRACHVPRPSGSTTPSYASTDPREFVAGFEPLDKGACSTCHKREAAGDRCTQCHRYHQ